MNRRLRILALAIPLLLILLALAKWAAYWRPVKIAKLTPKPMMYSNGAGVRVTPDAVLAGGGSLLWHHLDLKTGKLRVVRHEGLLADGTAVTLRADAKGIAHLILGGAKHNYRLPYFFDKGSYPANNFTVNLEAEQFGANALRVSPEKNRVELVMGANYCRWNQTTRQVEREVTFSNQFSDMEPWALTGDGESVVNAMMGQIRRYSTRTGKKTGEFKSTQMKMPMGRMYLSPLGSCALYQSLSNDMSSGNYKLFDTRNGALLWSAPTSVNDSAIAFTADEKLIALPQFAKSHWQFRNSQTGAIIRTLPLAPKVSSAAFSPDGATLYSVADGILYRQRAR